VNAMSATPEAEAARLADQRRADIASQRERELAAARKAGAREAEDTAHTKRQDERLDTLTLDLTDIKLRLSRIEVAIGESNAAAKAVADAARKLAEKGVSTRTFVLGVVVLGGPLIGLCRRAQMVRSPCSA